MTSLFERTPKEERKALAFLSGIALVLVAYALYRQYRPRTVEDE